MENNRRTSRIHRRRRSDRPTVSSHGAADRGCGGRRSGRRSRHRIVWRLKRGRNRRTGAGAAGGTGASGTSSGTGANGGAVGASSNGAGGGTGSANGGATGASSNNGAKGNATSGGMGGNSQTPCPNNATTC